MTEFEKRRHRVCFTGHRPEKLTRSEETIRKDLDTILLSDWQKEQLARGYIRGLS